MTDRATSHAPRRRRDDPTAAPQPNQPDAPPAEEPITFHDADEQERDFEGLVEEKGDFQEAVDATLRGEQPEEPGQSPMPV
jgi:hypothetical protein